MLTEQEIQQALHAHRVVPLSVANPHGPIGLEQVAAAVSRLTDAPISEPGVARIRRPIALSVQAWEKLEQLAQTAARTSPHPLSASEVATAIIEQYVASVGPMSE
jgi:hypothetical protein